MRFATAWVDDRLRLLLEMPTGLLDVSGLAPELGGVYDVGSLLRIGSEAIDTVHALSAARGVGPVVTIENVRWAPPIVSPSKIVCIGLNYRAHAAEGGDEIPSRPIIFAKFQSSLIGSDECIVHPTISGSLDYEGELGVVIGSSTKNLTIAEAAQVIAGFVVANDVSARDIQSDDPASQWVRGKSLDTFCPMGPYFTTADMVADWRSLRLQTWVNGEVRQNELCGDMIFGVEELVSFVSKDMTLEPGDVILTGTPSGVGAGFTPPRWLSPGDVVEVEISGLGRLTSRVVQPAKAQA